MRNCFLRYSKLDLSYGSFPIINKLIQILQDLFKLDLFSTNNKFWLFYLNSIAYLMKLMVVKFCKVV